MRTILDDLRFTLRQLRRSRGFLLTAVLTLTLAIAANIVVYGMADALLFRPLPIPQPRQVVQIQNSGFSGIQISYPNFRDLRDRSTTTFSSLALERLTRISLGIDGTAEPVWAFVVSGGYFPMLGLHPQLGRFLTPADDTAINGSPAIVLSDACWRFRFHADPDIVGKVVPVGKLPFTVVGVAPQGFHGTEPFLAPDVFLPFHDGPEVDGSGNFDSRGSTNAMLFGRLRPGISRTHADADLGRISQQMAQQFPAEDQGTDWHTANVGLFGETLGRPVRAFLTGIAALALLVLLAACANLAVLFSSRTADRSRELGIRLAIGSSRARILRQLALESVLIALLGGAAATALATLLLHALTTWRPPADFPVHLLADADWKIYLASAALALATGLLFATLPARQIWQTDPNRTMRSSGSTPTSDRSPFRSALLLIQIALCCLLVTASLVAVRGLERTFATPRGFDPHGVTLTIVDTALGGFPPAQQAATQERLLSAVGAIPGVTAAAYSNNQPLSLNSNSDDLYAPGTTTFDHAHIRSTPQVYRVSPGYFAATRTPLLAGRAFTDADRPDAPPVAILNRTLAQQIFGTPDAVGKRFPTGPGHETEVVGVVADGKYVSLAEDPTPALFRPILQMPDSTAVLFARSARPPAEMTVALRKAVAGVSPSIPIFTASAWTDALGIVTFPARAATLALGILGALAAMLATTGIFGVASLSVARRMRELGIRVALGAGERSILHAALGRTLTLLAAGSALGLLLGILSARLLAGVVAHATAADPLVLAGVVLTMLTLGAAACALPARRATRVDPAQLLREP